MTNNNLCALASVNREFALRLHILEHKSPAGPRYTVALWENTSNGAGLRAICHARPLSEALLAFAKEFNNGAERGAFEIKYPKWSEIAELVQSLRERGDKDSKKAAEMLEDFQARLHNASGELESTLERLARLGAVVEEAAAQAQAIETGRDSYKLIAIPQPVWFRLLAVYRFKQEGSRVYHELQALREIAGVTAETLRTVDDWLGSACTREAAMEALWRLRRILEGLGYYMPLEHLAWRGQIIRAMEEAGLGLGADGGVRIRQPHDRYWEPPSGPLVRDVLQNAAQPTT